MNCDKSQTTKSYKKEKIKGNGKEQKSTIPLISFLAIIEDAKVLRDVRDDGFKALLISFEKKAISR